MTEFSCLKIYINNPILVGIFGKYQAFFEDRGFSFEQSTESGNITLTYSDDEAPYIEVPTSLKTAARDFVMYNRFDFIESKSLQLIGTYNPD